jgi:hypothetical protein
MAAGFAGVRPFHPSNKAMQIYHSLFAFTAAATTLNTSTLMTNIQLQLLVAQ